MRIIVLLCFVVTARIAAAQTCTGSGAPIVNITFGQGFDQGPALPAGMTAFNFVADFCPTDGQYTIVSHSPDCFGSAWLPLGTDHTANQAGKYMLINGTARAIDFFVQKVGGLCAGATYQFSAWAGNVSANAGRVLPNIRFQIEAVNGGVLASFSSGDIPFANPFQWNSYAFYFTAPAGVDSVVLRMTNNASGSDGNDLAIDDISFRSVAPTVQVSAVGFSGDHIQVCDYAQSVIIFNAGVESCYPSQEVKWQQSVDSGASWQDIPGANALSYPMTPSGTGRWEYRLLVGQAGRFGAGKCAVESDVLVVDVMPKPEPSVSIVSSMPEACIGAPIHFLAASVDGGNAPAYQWLVNGLPAGEDSTGLTLVPAADVVVRCEMTSDAVCAVDPVVGSNIITLPAVPVPVQGLTIDASAVAICKDSLVRFVAGAVNGGDAPSFQWRVNGVDVARGVTYSTTGLDDGDEVNCVMTGSLICSQPVSADAGVLMTVHPLPEIVLDSLVVIAGGSGVRLEPVVTGNILTYSWSPVTALDNPSVAGPVASPAGTTTYQLFVVSADGCHATASETVEVYYPLRMPGGFTPNGDGRNDVFRVPSVTPVTIRSLAVFNRQGLRVFYTTDVGEGWDGRYDGIAQPAGTYLWELFFINPLTKKMEERKGTVVLVR